MVMHEIPFSEASFVGRTGLTAGPAIGLATGGEDGLAAGFPLQGVPLAAVGREKGRQHVLTALSGVSLSSGYA